MSDLLAYEAWWAAALDARDGVAGVLSESLSWTVIQWDAEEPIPGLAPSSVDAVISDPPAGISFMGREWDSDRGGEEQWIAWLSRCMERAFEALKPGGYAIVWALPRTSDWTAQALRRAGFEIRDSIHHAFGSGFPKSLDLSKAIDAHLGAQRPIVGARTLTGSAALSCAEKGGTYAAGTSSHGASKEVSVTEAATPEAKRWNGWGTALKPAHEIWWIARKPLLGSYAENLLHYGTGGINVDGGRIGASKRVPGSLSRHQGFPLRGNETGEESGHNPAIGRWPANFVLSHASWDETVCVCGLVLPCIVRFCPSCGSGDVVHRRGGCRCVGSRVVASGTTYEPTEARPRAVANAPEKYLGRITGYGGETGSEEMDAWECLATCDACGLSWLVLEGGQAPLCECGQQGRWACPVAVLDEQSGELVSGSRSAGVRKGLGYQGAYGDGGPAIEGSAGGCSRFFHCFAPDPIEPFFYSAKPATSETEAGCDDLPLKSAAENVDRNEDAAALNCPRTGAGRTSGRRNHHPTKKGMGLIGHLCDLVLRPGGVALDLFGGSGTLAAVVAHRNIVTGWRAIVTEISPEYVEIARARARHWGARRLRSKRTGVPKTATRQAQGSLFELTTTRAPLPEKATGRPHDPDPHLL